MDYYHDRRPYVPTHRDSYGQDGRGGLESRYSSSRLGVEGDRHLFPPTARSSSYSTPSSPRPHAYRRSRSQVRWPPSPFAESEAASMSREYKPRRWGEPDPPFRGAIDQDPLMVEVNPPKQAPKATSLRPESTVSSNQTKRGKSPAPPPIKTNLDTLPDFVERKPRPYNGAGAADGANKRASAEFLLSPHRITPTRSQSYTVDSSSSAGYRSRGPSPGVSPVRGVNTYPPPPYKPRRMDTTDGSDLDAEQAAKMRNRSRSARYSMTKAELANQTARKFVIGDSSDESLSDRASKLRSNNYRSSLGSPRSSRPTTPNSDNVRQSTQPPRTSSGSALSYKQTSNPTPATSSSSTSKQRIVPESISSQSSQGRFPYSPPHSPKLHPIQAASPRHAGSRAGSRQNSRPTTPQSLLGDTVPSLAMFDAVSQRLERQPTYPVPQDLRARNASRLSSTMRPDSLATPPGPRIDVQSPSPVPPARAPLPYPDLQIPKLPTAALPYPDEQSPFEMPSESVYQYQHFPGQSEAAPAEMQPRRAEKSRVAAFQRPPLMQRHSFAEGTGEAVNDSLTSPKIRTPLAPIRDEHAENVKKPAAPATNAPASCPRGRSSKGLNDWTSLAGDSTLNICPHCMEHTVNATGLSRFFAPVDRDPNERIKCDFNRPWIRLAWLLTLQQQRPDVDLLLAVSSVSKSDTDCPADEESKRQWYGFWPDDDEPIPDFYVCSRDRYYIQALFPSLKPCIDRVSRSTHTCSMDRGSSHFGSFLDTLIAIDEQARRSKQMRFPDFQPFQELVQKITIINNMPKCPRDNLAKGSEWHYLPGLPEFTVCSRCFIECVAPHIRTSTRTSPVSASAPLADQFTRQAQLLPRENSITRGMGSSCQLYSPRMRSIWALAVEDNDGKFLAKEVRERKAVEMSGMETYAMVQKEMENEEGYDKKMVKAEVERVREEWKKVE